MPEEKSIDIESLEQKARAASPGPWVDHADGMEFGSSDRSTNPGVDTADGQVVCWWGTGLCGIPQKPDAEFIASANPETVLTMVAEIKSLRGNYDAAVTRVKKLDLLFGRYILGMGAAVIEWQNGRGAEAGMEWVWNGLAGPGELPPENETQAQAYFDREVLPIETGLEEVHALLEQRRAAKRVQP
jgi:hypothetical protein